MSLAFWTDFADGAIMVPLGVSVGLLLALFGHRRAAIAWTAALATVWPAILLLKFAGYAVAAINPGSPLGAIGLVTPSGHVASATFIYGGLAALLLHGPGTLRRRALLAGIGVGLGIGLTRVLLEDHTAAEVVVGGLVGLLGLRLLARWSPAPIGGSARPVILGAAALIVILEHGTHLTWEPRIHRLSLQTVQALSSDAGRPSQ